MDSFVDLGFWYVSLTLFAGVVVRYFILSLVFDWFFSPKNAEVKEKYVYNTFPKNSQRLMEIGWSLLTSVMFAFLGAGVLLLWKNGFTSIYTNISSYPIWVIPIGILAVLFLHETMYYWAHRWMHHKSVFRWVHKVHHQSLVTSSWTAFSFHPIEGMLQLLMLVLIVVIVPLHYLVLLGLLIFMTLSSIINHLGVDFYPSKGNFRKWIIGAKHHALHHQHFHNNYGLYFTFWDRLMKTEKEDQQLN
jgi:sterol desaturase/sphingolipid hydroxylase (fatty acid hydroxylase superfamily)